MCLEVLGLGKSDAAKAATIATPAAAAAEVRDANAQVKTATAATVAPPETVGIGVRREQKKKRTGVPGLGL